MKRGHNDPAPLSEKRILAFFAHIESLRNRKPRPNRLGAVLSHRRSIYEHSVQP